MENVNLQIESSEWLIDRAVKLIEEYYSCDTEHERARLLPQLEYMKQKLMFEKKGLNEILKENGYDDTNRSF